MWKVGDAGAGYGRRGLSVWIQRQHGRRQAGRLICLRISSPCRGSSNASGIGSTERHFGSALRKRKVIAKDLALNSKTTLPLLDAAAHDEVVDVLRRLTVAYPDNTPNEVACCVARCALEHAGVKAEAIDEFMATVPTC
jgi:hypothetical protein